MPHFDALKIYSCGKNCEKGEIACNKQFLIFSRCFPPYMALVFHFKCTLKCCLQFLSIASVQGIEQGYRPKLLRILPGSLMAQSIASSHGTSV